MIRILFAKKHDTDLPLDLSEVSTFNDPVFDMINLNGDEDIFIFRERSKEFKITEDIYDVLICIADGIPMDSYDGELKIIDSNENNGIHTIKIDYEGKIETFKISDYNKEEDYE